MIAFEARLVRAAVRRLIAQPGRRAAWAAVSAAMFVACAVDIATGDMAHRNLGALTLPPWLVVAAVATVIVIAVLSGRTITRPYGTRAADLVWWRYAGIERRAAERATATILIVRTACTFGLVALPLGAAFAFALPAEAPAIMVLVASATALATLACGIALRSARDDDVVADHAAAAAGQRPATRVPRGIMAARWLLATRRGEPLTPWWNVIAGVVIGVVLTRLAASLNGQLLSLAVVIGPAAIVLGGAIAPTPQLEELRSPWWRAALGTRPRAVIAWAVGATLPTSLALSGMVGAIVGIAASPFVALCGAATTIIAVPTHRLISAAGDARWRRMIDRRGAATGVRIALHAIAWSIVVTAAWACAHVGIGAMIVVANAALLAIAALALRWITA